jgi:hypothetical protein
VTTSQPHSPSRGERVSSNPGLQQGSAVVPFPLALNRKLVSRLVDRFLAIPAGPDRAVIWRKKELGQLERKRRSQGIPPEIIQRELWQIERAVAAQLAAMFPNDGGAA